MTFINGWQDTMILVGIIIAGACVFAWHALRALRDYSYCPFCEKQRPVKVYWFRDFTEIYCKRCGKLLQTTNHYRSQERFRRAK